MAVKKPIKKENNEVETTAISDFIERGGKVVSENNNLKEPEEKKFTLRINSNLLEKIDIARKKNSEQGFISRNSWILKAILKHLK